jgi:hypothetical protein
VSDKNWHHVIWEIRRDDGDKASRECALPYFHSSSSLAASSLSPSSGRRDQVRREVTMSVLLLKYLEEP